MKKIAIYNIFNEIDFIEYSLKSVYPVVDRIIILEGAVKLFHFASNEGVSNDGTLEIIRNFPDPAKKISLISHPWESLIEKRENFLKFGRKGDIIITLAGDEVLKTNELRTMVDDLIGESKKYGVLNQFYYFYPDKDHIVSKLTPTDRYYSNKLAVRIFRKQEDLEYMKNKENICIHGKEITSYKDKLIDNNYYIYHYSRLRSKEKMINRTIYRAKRANDKNLEQKTRQKGTLQNYNFEEFRGTHPKVMKSHFLWRGLKFNTVCCYNNRGILEQYLLKSLKNQTMDNRLILIDNRENEYPSMAYVYNSVSPQINSEYIIFVHQDIDFVSPNWLKKTYEIIEELPNLGVVGCCGVDWDGRPYGNLNKMKHSRGCPHKVCTVDACIGIIPRKVFDKIKFDDKIFTSWHAYLEDICLQCHQQGLNVYAIDNLVEHNIKGINLPTQRGEMYWNGMCEEGNKLIKKWGNKFGKPIQFTWKAWATGVIKPFPQN